MYLLTSDRQGIAARLLRWSDRAETADSKRYTLLAGINNKVAALDPLGLIGFAPNDPYALPSSLLKRVDSTYRERKFAVPEFQTGELPPVLQKAARAAMDRWMKDGRSLDTRTVQINTELTCQLVLRGGIAVEPSDYGRYFGGQYLQKIAHPETPRPASKPAKPGVSAKPVVLPALAGRRVLLLPLPEDAATVQQLLQTAKRKGFGEAWFRVSAGDAAQVARLAAAVRVGRKIGMPVGAVVEVLRDYPGTPDINLLGETGAVFTKRKIAQNPSRDYYNWQYPSTLTG